jgi:putative polyketide hydroxylase
MFGNDMKTAVPVLITGAGPAGLVAAVTLARHGVGSLLVERRSGLSPLARATGVSTRTMELLRSWGLEAQVRAGEVAIVDAGAWATETLAAPDGVMLPSGFPSREQVAAVSSTALAAVPQEPPGAGAARAPAGARGCRRPVRHRAGRLRERRGGSHRCAA